MAIRTANYSKENGNEVITHTVTYEGKVVATGEHNWHDDSDFYAVVALDDGTFREIQYATTRFYTYDNSASVDAPPELLAAYSAHLEAKAKADARADWDRRQQVLAVGKAARIAKGRKYPVGTEGVIIWVGKGYSYHSVRVGLKLADGQVLWVDGKNIQIVLDEKGDAVVPPFERSARRGA